MTTIVSEAIVDWISYSLPVYPGEADVWTTTMNAITSRTPQILRVWDPMLNETSGRAPYDRSYTTTGMRIYAGKVVDNVAVEISGIGCKLLRERALTDELLKVVAFRTSRVDVALDIETDLKPTDFVNAGYSGRIRSIGTIVSDSGETVYVGSQKSDRFCRVYRYAEPHERSHLLRIEYVFRRKEAKLMAEKIASEGLEALVSKINGTFDWKHPIMADLTASSGLTASVAHRTKAKTLRWLIKQVAPAFRKLVADGVIDDPEHFIATHFLGKQ